MAQHLSHCLGSFGKTTIYGQTWKQIRIRSPHLAQPGTLAFDLAQLSHQQDGEDFAVGELLLGGSSAFAGCVGTAIASVQPFVYDAVDDHKQIGATEIVR